MTSYVCKFSEFSLVKGLIYASRQLNYAPVRAYARGGVR